MAGENTASTQPQIAHGQTVIQYSDGGSPTETWTSFARLVAPPALSDTANFVDATNMDSPGRSKQYIPGLSDPQEFSFNVFYLPNDAAQELLESDKKNGTLRRYRIIYAQPYPDSPKQKRYLEFCAYVGSLGFDVSDAEALVQRTITMRPEGAYEVKEVLIDIPLNLAADVTTAGQVTLTADAPAASQTADITGLTFYRASTDSSGAALALGNADVIEPTIAAAAGDAGITFVDTGVESGKTYYYFVRAQDSLRVLSDYTASVSAVVA